MQLISMNSLLINSPACSLLHMDSSHICLPDGAAPDGMLCLLQHPSVLSVNCLLILLWCWLFCAVMNTFIQIVSLFAIFCFMIISLFCVEKEVQNTVKKVQVIQVSLLQRNHYLHLNTSEGKQNFQREFLGIVRRYNGIALVDFLRLTQLFA